jgi:F-type H+-transporting ATPase subunit gamma
VSRRRELEERRHQLGEIQGIMNSMKTLAYLETRKLSRFLDQQQIIVDNIEAMAADFVSFFPETLPTLAGENTKKNAATTDIYVLLGSERGFCGNFNEALLPVMDSCATKDSDNKPLIIAIGHKLNALLEVDPRVIARLDGASVVEEAEEILTCIVDNIASLLDAHPNSSLYVIHHSESRLQGNTSPRPQDEHQVLMKKLLPPFQAYSGNEPAFSHPPILNVTPADFLLAMTDQYLLAAMYEILYTSLMAENHHRVQHLEGAVQHMDDKANELASQCNALRQEEIIEEIEVILLSAESLM